MQNHGEHLKHLAGLEPAGFWAAGAGPAAGVFKKRPAGGRYLPITFGRGRAGGRRARKPAGR